MPTSSSHRRLDAGDSPMRRRHTGRRLRRPNEVLRPPDDSSWSRASPRAPRRHRGAPERRRHQDLAAAVARARGKARCGALLEPVMHANDAEEHGEDDGHVLELKSFMVARRGTPRRRESPASMAKGARVRGLACAIARVNQNLTVRRTEAVAWSEELHSGRI